MILHLLGDVNPELFDKLISSINGLEEKEILHIYLNSVGGEVDNAEAIIDLINENQNKIKLTAFGEINSCAFDIFFRSKCEREILPKTMGIAHFTGVKVNKITNKNYRDPVSGPFYIKWSEIFLEQCVRLYKKLGFTEKELVKISKGEDLYFLTDRLLEFLNNSNIGKHNEYIQ